MAVRGSGCPFLRKPFIHRLDQRGGIEQMRAASRKHLFQRMRKPLPFFG